MSWLSADRADDIARIVDPGRLTVDVGRQVRRVGGIVEVGEGAGRLLIDVGELQRRPGDVERRVTHILTNVVIAEQLVKRRARRNHKAEHAAIIDKAACDRRRLIIGYEAHDLLGIVDAYCVGLGRDQGIEGGGIVREDSRVL